MDFFRKHQAVILFCLMLIWGVGLRAIYPGTSPFEFDQVQIAQQAQSIAHGHLTLIGPRTGPANTFTGPLIYYIAALFTFFVTPGFATVLAAVAISAVTGLSLYYLCRRYSPAHAVNICMLWAFSPLLVQFDRTPWNPNLSVLAASFVFFPLLKKEKLNLPDVLHICVGVFLGYQAHFSGLLLLPLAVVCLLLRRQFRYIVPAVLSFLLTLLPTVLFDTRHDWMNYKGLLTLLSNKEAVDTYQILPRILSKFYVVIETMGKLFFDTRIPRFTIITGVIVWGLFLLLFSVRAKWVKKTTLTDYVIPLLWPVCVIVLFALYRQGTPEYYFFILIPVMLFVSSSVLLLLKGKEKVLLLMMGIYASLMVYTNYHDIVLYGPTLGNQVQAVNRLAALAANGEVRAVTLDMEPTKSLGLQYLLSQKPPTLNPDGAVVHFIFPNPTTLYETQRFGRLTLWVDNRKTDGTRYAEFESNYIGVPSTLQVAQVLDANAQPTVFLITDSSFKQLGVLKRYEKVQGEKPAEFPSTEDVLQKTSKDEFWKPVYVGHETAWLHEDFKQAFLVFTSDANLASQIEVINRP